MKVPKEIADKVKTYQEGNKAFADVVEWLREHTDADGVYINDLFLTNMPSGEPQGDGEYCDQWRAGYAEGAFAGAYYHPIEGSTLFLCYRYET